VGQRTELAASPVSVTGVRERAEQRLRKISQAGKFRPQTMGDQRFDRRLEGGRSPGPGGGSPDSSPASLAGVGFQFVGSILLFLFIGKFIGKWLDSKLGTDPWLLILGVFIGAAGGFYSMYRKVVAAQRQHDSPHDDEHGGR
jgi:hypothetical protein